MGQRPYISNKAKMRQVSSLVGYLDIFLPVQIQLTGRDLN